MIHQTLKEVRKEKGMTLQEVSDRTNIPVRTIERIESGETRLDMGGWNCWHRSMTCLRLKLWHWTIKGFILVWITVQVATME